MLVPSLNATYLDAVTGDSSPLALVPGSAVPPTGWALPPADPCPESSAPSRELSFTSLLEQLGDSHKPTAVNRADELPELDVLSECSSIVSDGVAEIDWAAGTGPSAVTVPPPPTAVIQASGRTARPSRQKRKAARKSSIVSAPASEDEGCSASPLPEYTGPIPESYWSLTELQIATISFKDFTKLMAKSKLSPKEVDDQKKLRRRVKNRFSARQCSERKKSKVQSTDGENLALRKKVDKLAEINASLQQQHMLLQERFIEQQKRDADHVRERLYLRSEVERLRKLLSVAALPSMDGVLGPDTTPPTFAPTA